VSKNYRLIVFVALLIVLGIAAYLSMNFFSASVENATLAKPNTISSLKDALSTPSSFECTMIKGDTPQVAYIKNGKIRIDDASQGSGTGQSLLITNEFMFAWSEKGGVKIALDQNAKNSVEVFEKQIEQVTGNPEGITEDKLSCQNKFVDDARFIPPTDISFYEIGSAQVGVFDKQ
jgi:hypothetical protein